MSNGTAVNIQVQPNGGHRTNVVGSRAYKYTPAGQSKTFIVNGATLTEGPAGGHRTLAAMTTPVTGDGTTKTTVVE